MNESAMHSGCADTGSLRRLQYCGNGTGLTPPELFYVQVCMHAFCTCCYHTCPAPAHPALLPTLHPSPSPATIPLPQDPNNPLGTRLVRAGQNAVLKSLQTGLFCRLAIYIGGETMEGLVVVRVPPSRQQASVAQPPWHSPEHG